MKVLLMNPPMKEEELFTDSAKQTASRIPPLGLGYLAAYLEQEGHEVKIWDGFVEKDSWEEISKLAEEYDLLGIHTLTSFVLRAYEFAQFLKQKLPDKPLVFGGCHATALPLEAMEKPFIDYVVVGEGEITTAELCQKLDNQDSDMSTILGIYYRDQSGKVLFNGPRKNIENINLLPFPARHLFNWELYKSSEARKSSARKDMAILTSRGCPYQCSYCSKDITGHKVRNFSLDRVMAEIKYLIKEYGIEELSIWDETFTLFRERVIEFCHLLKQENLNLTWSCSSRVDREDLDLLRTMKANGCNFIAYGIESGNDEVLKKMNKGITKDLVRKAITVTKKAKIPIRGYFMVGLWGDTPNTILDTIKFAKELDPEIATFTMMVPLPKTLDYARACQQDNFTKEYWKHRMFPEFNFLDSPLYVPEGMTSSELVELHKKAYSSFYFRPKFLLQQVTSIRSIQDIKRLLAGAKTILKI